MTAIALTDAQLDRAFDVSRQIGSALRAARRASGQKAIVVARACDSAPNSMFLLERGASPNVRLSHVLKFLNYFGLTLSVTALSRDP